MTLSRALFLSPLLISYLFLYDIQYYATQYIFIQEMRTEKKYIAKNGLDCLWSVECVFVAPQVIFYVDSSTISAVVGFTTV